MTTQGRSIHKHGFPRLGVARLGLSPWIVSLTLVLFCLGIFLAVQWNSQWKLAPASDARAGEVYGATLKRLEEEQKQLKSSVESLQKEMQGYQEQAGLRKDSRGEIAEELRVQRLVAGMATLKGPGIKAALDDSKRSPAQGENPNLYIIHDYQVRDVVNLLWQAGAEAISINSERFVPTTSIYSSGGTIMVNSTRLSPPFVVQAIGDADKMMGLIDDPASLRTLKGQAQAYGLALSYQKDKELKVPAFQGSYANKFLNVGRP
ncbi:MAG: DUF881 domain-containing protein [Dehalococcoidia bacterium]|nr:DUF881 domain-containing protein [Dehalococcoidia bacterium]